MIPVILAGGTGSRLWPLSRSAYPKQFLRLTGQQTMLQQTVQRALSLSNVEKLVVICNQEHRFLVAEQLKEIGVEDAIILLEPVGKNTAPAVAIAALYLRQMGQDNPILLVLPADHVIDDQALFVAAVSQAAIAASHGHLVTFGIQPLHPETGYGYIKTAPTSDSFLFTVEQFVEKPNQLTAISYVDSGEYYWNSGMFMFQATSFLGELRRFRPDILSACDTAVSLMTKDLDFCRLEEKSFLACPSDSIDYAVMEKTNKALLVVLDAAWNDVGSWSALRDILPRDENENAILGDVLSLDTQGCYLRAESRMLAVLGMTDTIVIETADAVLVAHQDRVQDVKKIVEFLKQEKRTEVDLHCRVYRPWGSYESIDQGKNFQVKRITVKPGARLSLQMHHRRSEHWIVVTGVADVVCGDQQFSIGANQSTYIPKGTKHRLSNSSDQPLDIIEIQLGDYLGEDDIVRFEDIYGR